MQIVLACNIAAVIQEAPECNPGEIDKDSIAPMSTFGINNQGCIAVYARIAMAMRIYSIDLQEVPS